MSLKLTWIELFIRIIPEGFLFIFAAYAFTKTAVDSKKYLISSVLHGITVYSIRLLPIQYGVHTILNIFITIILLVIINKIDVVKSIRAVIITYVLGFVTEGINVFIIQFILKKDLNAIFNNAVLKTLYGTPSLIIFWSIIIVYYFRLSKRKELKYI
jgi:hypothetical protein